MRSSLHRETSVAQDATTRDVAAASGGAINDATTTTSSVWSSSKTDSQITTAVAGASTGLTTTAVKSANYTAGPNELVPVDASAAPRTITLPTAPADKTQQTIKKIDGTAAAPGNAVTVNCGGSDVFNKTGGVASATLSLANQAITVQYDVSRHVWTVVGDDLPLSDLDVRYPLLDTGGRVPIARVAAGSTITVQKDVTTGFWPVSYNADGSPVYTGGSASAGVRPTSSANVTCRWKGADPSPAIVSSGTGGMLDNVDMRDVTS